MRERPPDTAPAPSAASGAEPCESAQGAVQTLKEYRKNKRLRSRANKAAKRAGGQVFPPPLAMGAPNSKPAPAIAHPPGAVLTTPDAPSRPWQKAPFRQTAWKGAKSRGKGKPKGKGKGKVKSKKQGSWPRNWLLNSHPRRWSPTRRSRRKSLPARGRTRSHLRMTCMLSWIITAICLA